MSGISIKRRMFGLQLRNVDLIKAINDAHIPYQSGVDGILHVHAGEMSNALNDCGGTPKHQAILEAADEIIAEWENSKHDAGCHLNKGEQKNWRK